MLKYWDCNLSVRDFVVTANTWSADNHSYRFWFWLSTCKYLFFIGQKAQINTNNVKIVEILGLAQFYQLSILSGFSLPEIPVMTIFNCQKHNFAWPIY